MKLIVDKNIPYLADACQTLFPETEFLSGEEISQDKVHDAAALIVRTRTKVDRNLLQGSKVEYVVTATIGYDHLDVSYLNNNGISWTNCPGCNASSVAQYVRNSLIRLKCDGKLNLQQAVIGIVGVGHVGKEVYKALKEFGCKLMLNDISPQHIDGAEYYPLEKLAKECNVITFHVPLTHMGSNATFHMINDLFISSLRQKPCLINAARGEVADTQSLLNGLNNGKISNIIIDTWEGEPHPNEELLRQAFIATPHIAGYSADGKANAARMALHALCRHFNVKPAFHINPPALPVPIMESTIPEEKHLQYYDPMEDTRKLKENPHLFEKLRNNYPIRRES